MKNTQPYTGISFIRKRIIFFGICFFFLSKYTLLSAMPIPEDARLKVVSGKMLFTLVKKNSSGYDPSMTEFASMTGLANQVSGFIDMKEKSFNITMDVSVETFLLSGKFKFANNRMHDIHLESSKYPAVNYKGTIVSYNSANGKAKVMGKMTVHGVTKENVTIEGIVTPAKAGNEFLLAVDFDVNLNDFKIEVPNTKLTKVSEIVKLKIKLELKNEK